MIIKQLLNQSINAKASDLHLVPGLPPMLRIDGDLNAIEGAAPLDSEEVRSLIFSLLTEAQQQEFEHKLVLDLALHLENIGHFRVSLLHQKSGVAGVYRLIPEKIPSFEELDLPRVLKRLLGLHHGLILVTGPTGSGKSTTLAVMVDHINSTQAKHIITIEEPIEFIHQHKKSAINQIEVGRDSPSVEVSLRASLRQDPDIIMLGELRDLETIRLALTAAETGHLVLATLHASSAPLAVNRMIDVFPHAEKNRVRNLLAETAQAIICQTLVKRINKGRVAAFEIMLATPAIRHLIRQDMIPHMESTIQTNGDIGMCTMDQYLQELVAKRLISNATARSATSSIGPV